MNRPSAGNGARVTPADYQKFREFLEKACGILLGDNKQYLVASRLNRIMAENGISCLSELIERMQQIAQRPLKEAVIDAMTTNETLWFRDSHPFELFKKRLLPEFVKEKKGTRMRVWSAACSSGQEPYSLSMMLDEFHAENRMLPKPQLEIVATDLSKSMLNQCKKAEYDGLSLGRGLSQERLKKFFDPVAGDVYRVKNEVRQRVRFQPLNLMDSYLTLGKFDIIYCRNVLIYFSADLKLDILRRLHGALKPGGYLLLGASESLSGLPDKYEMIHCHPGIIYKAI
jgi:chemotaxis protein methyltransferase CheR